MKYVFVVRVIHPDASAVPGPLPKFPGYNQQFEILEHRAAKNSR